MMKRTTILALSFIVFYSITPLWGQFKIDFQINNYTNDSLRIGEFLGIQQNFLDTLVLDNNTTTFSWQSTEMPPAGKYYFMLSESDIYIPFFIDSTENNITLELDANNTSKGLNIQGGKANQLYYDNYRYKSEKNKQIKVLREAQKSLVKDSPEFKANQNQITALINDVNKNRNETIEKAGSLITALELRLQRPINPPANLNRKQKFSYAKQHWFDEVDFTDDRIARLPDYFAKLDHYMTRMTPGRKDSVLYSLDYVMTLPTDKSETFKQMLEYFKNRFTYGKAALSDIIHKYTLRNYYLTSRAFWLTPDEKRAVRNEYNKLPRLIIGQSAPDVKMGWLDTKATSTEENPYTLHDPALSMHGVEATAKVIFVWDPDCSHCKKELPDFRSITEKYKDRGVKVFAVCNKGHNKIKKCTDYINENIPEDWYHLVDPRFTSGFKSKYGVTGTPSIFVLDKNNKLVSPKIKINSLEKYLNKAIGANQ